MLPRPDNPEYIRQPLRYVVINRWTLDGSPGRWAEVARFAYATDAATLCRHLIAMHECDDSRTYDCWVIGEDDERES